MNTQRGFTLVELLITLAIASILITVAVPSFRTIVLDNRLSTHANDFIADIQLARSEAIKRQRNTQICISTTFANNPPTCTGGTNWTAGWIVWVDIDRDNAVDAGEVIQVHEPFSGNATLTSAAKSSFRYDSIGLVDGADTLTLCDDRNGERGRQITISNAGRPSVADFVCP